MINSFHLRTKNDQLRYSRYSVLPKVFKTSPLQHVPTSKKKKKYAVKIYEAQASSYYQPNVSNIRIGIIQYHLITT